MAESSTLVSKTGITSSYVLRGFHAQYDHSFGALQVAELFILDYLYNLLYLSCSSLRSILCSALDLSVLNMEGNFGTFLTDDFFSHILIRHRPIAYPQLPELVALQQPSDGCRSKRNSSGNLKHFVLRLSVGGATKRNFIF